MFLFLFQSNHFPSYCQLNDLSALSNVSLFASFSEIRPAEALPGHARRLTIEM